jgi:hypothetical protein
VLGSTRQMGSTIDYSSKLLFIGTPMPFTYRRSVITDFGTQGASL